MLEDIKIFALVQARSTTINALTLVGAQVYSLAQPNVPNGPTLGEPNTFFFGYRDPNPPAGPGFMSRSSSLDERESAGGIVVDYGPNPNAPPAP